MMSKRIIDLYEYLSKLFIFATNKTIDFFEKSCIMVLISNKEEEND